MIGPVPSPFNPMRLVFLREWGKRFSLEGWLSNRNMASSPFLFRGLSETHIPPCCFCWELFCDAPPLPHHIKRSPSSPIWLTGFPQGLYPIPLPSFTTPLAFTQAHKLLIKLQIWPATTRSLFIYVLGFFCPGVFTSACVQPSDLSAKNPFQESFVTFW